MTLMLTCTFEDGGTGSLRHVVVDALVLQDNKILLVKRSKKLLLEGGKWGDVGGFMDKDETAKQAAEREILEETGYRVKDLTLLTIRDNPDRPKEDRQNISFVFFCTATEKVGEGDWESTEEKWFALDDLPPENEIAFDHYENIKLYLRYLKENLKLPIFN